MDRRTGPWRDWVYVFAAWTRDRGKIAGFGTFEEAQPDSDHCNSTWMPAQNPQPKAQNAKLRTC